MINFIGGCGWSSGGFSDFSKSHGIRWPSERIGYDTSLISPMLDAELATFQFGGARRAYFGGRCWALFVDNTVFPHAFFSPLCLASVGGVWQGLNDFCHIFF